MSSKLHLTAGSAAAGRYQLDGETAHLRGTPPRGGENIAPFNMHYEITVRK